MSLELGVFQNSQLSQQLNLAPQLLQWLRLLQVPTTELSTLVQHELETNPALEVDEGYGQAQTAPDDSGPVESPSAEAVEMAEKLEALAELDAQWRMDRESGGVSSDNGGVEAQERHQFMMDCVTADTSLHEHVFKQIATLDLHRPERDLAELIAGSLDDRGYLAGTLAELALMCGINSENAETVLRRVQELDPPGIAARDLRECLLLQLRARFPEDSVAVRMVRDHMDAMAARNWDALADALDCERAEVDEAFAEVTSLNPEPGAAWSEGRVHYVSPDVTVTRRDGRYAVEVNDDTIPHLRLSASCRRLMEQGGLTPRDLAYIRKKMRGASFLIQGIGQRQETLRRVTEEIVRVQQEYLDDPNSEPRPLTMVKVAGVLGVHETTVSRAIANKYLQTPHGLFEMKHFFRTGYQCSDGTTLTAESVKDMIESLVAGESHERPLTDLDIVQALKGRGLRLARRTVAKYRDEMGIPSSKERGNGVGRAIMALARPTNTEREDEAERLLAVACG